MPGFIAAALLLPSLFYVLFVVVLTDGHDGANDLFWLANYVSFAAIAPGLFAFGLATACEAENGFLQWKRALPMPRCAYPGAKLAVSVLTAVMSALLLILVAKSCGRALPQAAGAARLLLAAALGTLPFCALGMLIGSFTPGRSAGRLVNLLLIPLAFFSGLLVPLDMLPGAFRTVALFSPGYDLLALALAAIKPDPASAAIHATYLLLFAAVLGALAQWRLKSNS
jgi:ABC-2 type transport system permease protein